MSDMKTNRHKREAHKVICGTCGEVETFYNAVQLDLQDKQYASEDEMMKDIEASAPKLSEPFFDDIILGTDNVDYLVNFCSTGCRERFKADPAYIPEDRRKVFMDYNEPEDFSVSL
jgi:hypothetical protein